jgi:hypothetical protein
LGKRSLQYKKGDALSKQGMTESMQKKVGLRRLFRLENVTGSFNPYGFQDDEVKTGFRMTSMEIPAQRPE